MNKQPDRYFIYLGLAMFVAGLTSLLSMMFPPTDFSQAIYFGVYTLIGFALWYLGYYNLNKTEVK